MLIPALSIHAQENERAFGIDVSADLVSRYVWRGMSLSASPAIQPDLSLTYGKLTLGTWASYTFSPEPFQEVDLYLTYATPYLTFTINDYYNPVDSIGFVGDYFQWGRSTTRHTLEGMVTFNGPESFPISLMAGLMFYGNDIDEEGKNYYSTYLELSYPFEIKEVEILPFLGFTPAEGYYGDGIGIVNLGLTATRTIDITEKFQLPLYGSLILNPTMEQVYFVVGLTF